MSWSYRVIKHNGTLVGTEPWYSIHAVYRRQDGSIKAWSVSPVTPHGGTLGELAIDLKWMQAAFQKPILTEQENKLVEITDESPQRP